MFLTVLTTCWRIRFDSQTLFLFNTACMAHVSDCVEALLKPSQRPVLPALWHTARSLSATTGAFGLALQFPCIQDWPVPPQSWIHTHSFNLWTEKSRMSSWTSARLVCTALYSESIVSESFNWGVCLIKDWRPCIHDYMCVLFFTAAEANK